ncbi:MAG: thiamine phosphate synthase [Vicinamibacterales bacterium]
MRQPPRRPGSLSLPRLYAIVDVEACARAGRAPLDVTRALLSAGVRCLQLRAKPWGSGAMLDLAQAMVADAAAAGAVVIINDRVDVAAIAGAHGVHVGQDDLPPAEARRIVGEPSILGFSTHTAAQLLEGLAEPVSYLAVGPVFGTGTKATGYEAIGLEAVERAAAIVMPQAIPLVAIGGITLDRAPMVIAAGATSVAVISDLLAGDPEARARAFLRALA